MPESPPKPALDELRIARSDRPEPQSRTWLVVLAVMVLVAVVVAVILAA